MRGMARGEYDVIILGVGAMGSAAAYQLAGRGARVLGLEQFDIPHARGSSHGYSRMIRTAYFEHPDYVPLLRRAYELWRELEQVSGQTLLHLTGGLYLGRLKDPLISGSLGAAREHALAHEMLSREELRRRFGQFHVPDDFVGFFETNAGFLTPERVVAAYAEAALRRGADLRGHQRVLDWSRDGSGFVVRTREQTWHAARLIICAGAWSGKLVESLGVSLTVTRQVLGWVWPPRTDRFAYGTFPVWAMGHADGSLHYGFPMMPDNPGFKIAHHAPQAVVDPDAPRTEPQIADESSFRPFLQSVMPDADGPLLALRTCFYTNSPDHHFIIDRLPGCDGVTIACGFSGHGFKFASVIGEVLADLAMNGVTPLPVGFLGLARFNMPG